jgi:hypothetical protein
LPESTDEKAHLPKLDQGLQLSKQISQNLREILTENSHRVSHLYPTMIGINQTRRPHQLIDGHALNTSVTKNYSLMPGLFRFQQAP